MKEHFLNSTVNFLCKYNTYSDFELKKLKYGLEGIYLTITKLIIIIILSLILNMFKEVFLVLVFFNIIRYFGFGFHAEKSSECLFLSIINFVIIPFIFIRIDFQLCMSLIISSFCIINYILFAPADTIKRPLKNKKKRIVRKILTILTALIYVLVIVISRNSYITSILLSALIVQVIMVCPITYKLFRQPYNNYKKIS